MPRTKKISKKTKKKTITAKKPKNKKVVKKIEKKAPKKIAPKEIIKEISLEIVDSIPDEAIVVNELVETRPAVKAPRAKRGTGAIMYFTKDTEDAIVKYNLTHDSLEKNKIYNEKIRFAFEKIAENIFNTFKFSYNEVSPDKVQQEAVSHMVANIEKYEKDKGKAFSYFSIVAKHWFILENNNNYRRFKKHTTISEQPGEIGEFVVEPEHERKENETREFIKLMVEYWDKNVGTYFNKDRDLEIANAVIEIFRNADRIDVFNKKALYLYIREIADCQTQHITKVINRMKDAQKSILEEYLSKGYINSNG
jgi:hypothetical protein